MRTFLTTDVFSNIVAMLRAEVDGAIWLSDGDDDARLHERLAHVSARVISAPTKAREVLLSVKGRGIAGVLATIYAESNPEEGNTDLIAQDYQSALHLLISGRACGVVIERACGTTWVRACERTIGSVEGRAIRLAAAFATVKEAARAQLNYEMVPSEMSDAIDWATLELQEKGLLELMKGCGMLEGTAPQIGNTAISLSREIAPTRWLSSDALHFICEVIRRFRPRGLVPHATPTGAEFTNLLMTAFTESEFEALTVFWRLRLWEQRNRPYLVLKDWRSRDPLGAFVDQRYWESDLVRLLSLVGPSGHLSVFKMDLDNFKSVNEHLGHSGGDEAIRLYGDVVNRVLGTIAQVYRRGGDEVVAVSVDMDRQQMRQLAEAVHAEIERAFAVWAQDRSLPSAPTASIGVVRVRGSLPALEVMRLMDRAQQSAKTSGKNRVVYLEE